jgi:hypothetical protein
LSTHIDVPLDSLFFSEVIKSNTNDDGTEKDTGLLRRMQNPICQNCQSNFKAKYPDKPFNIKCKGIYDENDFAEMKEGFETSNPGETISIEEIQEIYDPVYWAHKYIMVKDQNGDMQPFEARWYQEEVLKCTSTHKVDRMGRGLGKTITGVIEELHKVATKKKYEVLVICPGQSQSQMWFDQILLQIENSPLLRDSLAQRKQQPFFYFRFFNGSTISIFTAGSKSGRGADGVRGQSPHRVRIDEQDYLADKDYQAIMPLLRRYSHSEFHGASTPSGLRGMFWQMCTRLSEYREFYYPITVHPEWGPAKEAQCIAEAKTMDRYRHEFLAEFGDPEQGVFKGIFIERAKNIGYKYDECRWDPTKKYFMGVDWNGKGTGTKIRILEYDPLTKKRRCVVAQSVDEADSTTVSSLHRIRDLNRAWRCEDIYIDYGFGAAQDELLRLMGRESDHALDKKLMQIKVIDFGATLEFNALISKRDHARSAGSLKKAEEQTEHINEDGKIERHTKPFMVDGAVMVFESELINFSPEDWVLEEQLRAYRVKTYSIHGYANVYEAGDVGDHDLDAFILALLACEMKYGLFQTQESIRRLAQILNVPGFGMPSVSPAADRIYNEPAQARRNKAGIPARASTHDQRDAWRIQYLMRNGAYMAPVRGSRSSTPGVGSRTEVFRRPPKRTIF